MKRAEIIRQVRAQVSGLSEQEIIDLITESGIDPGLYTKGHVNALVKKARAKSAASIVPVEQTNSVSIAKVEEQPTTETAPLTIGGADSVPTAMAKIELPEDDSAQTLTAELEGCFSEGAQVADLKLQAMVAGHDIRMRQGMSAIVGRRVNPFGSLGEIKLKAPDFTKTVELTNPFVEGA